MNDSNVHPDYEKTIKWINYNKSISKEWCIEGKHCNKRG